MLIVFCIDSIRIVLIMYGHSKEYRAIDVVKNQI